MKIRDILMKINESELDGAFSDLYGKAPAVLTMQKDRYIRALEEFGKVFPEVAEKFFAERKAREEKVVRYSVTPVKEG